MTTFYADALDGVLDGSVPSVPGDAALLGGKVHAIATSIALDAKTVLIGDTIRWGKLPKGAVPLYGLLVTDTSLGTATIDVGVDGTAAKFRAAAVFTATDTPTMFGKADALGVAMTAERWLQSVVAVANLPTTAGARLVCIFLYTLPHSG